MSMLDIEAEREAQTLKLLETLVQIGAPTGQEHARARFVASWLTEAGLGQPVMDEHANVWLRLGPKDEPAVLFDAHLDTVFPDQHVTLQKHGNWWQAMGISDNTIHIAMLMVWAKYRHQSGQPWPATILCFTTGEEGQGNLRGMKAVTARLGADIRQVVVLDCGIRTLIHQAVGSLRWNVQITTPGGHSWVDFGASSAIHVACQWVAKIDQLPHWKAEKTTWNIGQIAGGQSINTIAPQLDLSLEVRSVEADRLSQIGDDVIGELHQLAADRPDVNLSVQCVGRRPAGITSPNDPLVKAVQRTHEELGLELRYAVASTNANWPMHLGIPAVCIGLAQGRGGHTPQDAVDISLIGPGMKKMDAIFKHLHGA